MQKPVPLQGKKGEPTSSPRKLTHPPPETSRVADLLRKLDETMIDVAPTSHLYGTDHRADHSRAIPAVGSSLKRTSALRGHRESVTMSEIMAHSSHLDVVALADKLRFAKEDDLVSAAIKARFQETSKASTLSPHGRAVPRLLGEASMSRDALAARFGAKDHRSIPSNAEVLLLQEAALESALSAETTMAGGGAATATARLPAAASARLAAARTDEDATSADAPTAGSRSSSSSSSSSIFYSAPEWNAVATRKLGISAQSHATTSRTILAATASLQETEKDDAARRASSEATHHGSLSSSSFSSSHSQTSVARLLAAQSAGMTQQKQKAKVLRDTVGAVMSASGAKMDYETDYRKCFAYSKEMQATVSGRDMSHALKSDEDRRYAEEKIKFDRMLGGGRGVEKGITKGGKAATAKA